MNSNFNGPLTIEVKPNGRRILRTYKNKWDPIKKRSHRVSAMQVGTLLDDNRVKFSKPFLAQYPEFENQQLYYHDHQFLDQKAYLLVCEGSTPTTPPQSPLKSSPLHDKEPNPIRYNTLQAEATALVLSIIHDLKIDNVLWEIFNEDGVKLLHLLIYSVLSERAWSHYPHWIKTHYPPQADDLSEESLYELLSSITSEQFDQCWNAIANLPRESTVNPLGLQWIAFDVTSTSRTSASHRDLTPQGEALDQLSLLLTVHQASGDVINAQVNDGALHDALTHEGFLQFVTQHDVSKDAFCVVTDHALKDDDALGRLASQGMHFVYGGIDLQNKTFAQDVNAQYASLCEMSTLRPEIDRHVCTLKKTLGLGESGTKPVYLHLYRDPTLEHNRSRRLQWDILRAQHCLNTKNPLKRHPALVHLAQTFLTYDESSQTWSVNSQRFKEEQKTLGMLGLVTDVMSDPVDAWNAYRERNLIERGLSVFNRRFTGRTFEASYPSFVGNALLLSLAQAVILKMMHPLTPSKNTFEGSVFNLLDELDHEIIVRSEMYEP